ncbi:tetratricopeptide repeat protein (macronuclear) [Tetrahymena thermophila SB210]|uniref:Tetratricopeptide repeat protein n=1 Tax=Tetrahymena thermophila (strain SB210) TaxID=312017 RepID=I7LXM6_TETTS|nr:tetratricopeptide repeat protein [Tetrahymena thermophila SB210]EAS04941.2 tetratricopeptide repeat protein [Tetrahymena thermophila SB210]|eukprot:XP_001025186.2 tetratricopeptide repeat protein [Tetrahymena thermophila SB210]
MFVVKALIKQRILSSLQQQKLSASKFIGLHNQVSVLSYFSSLKKKSSSLEEKVDALGVEDDYNNDDFEILKMSTQKNSIEDLQNQIFLQEYQSWMQGEQELYQELRNLKYEIFQELTNQDIQNHIGIVESRNQGIDSNIVVMQVDQKQLTKYLNEANSFLHNQNYQKALEFYFMCVLNDSEGFCQQNKIFRQIGIVYSSLKDSEKAIKYFHKQLDGERDKKGTNSDKSWLKDIHTSFLLLAKEYEQINKFQKACKFYDLCLKIEYDQEMCLHYASILFNKQRNYKRSIKLFEKIFSQNSNYIYQFGIVYEYLTSLIIIRQYLKTYTILEGKIDLSKYTFDAINYKGTQINQQDIIKDWRILFIYRLAQMHSKANLNFYLTFFFQTLYEVLTTDLYIKNIKNLEQYSELNQLKQSSNTFYQYHFEIDHIELLDSLVNVIPQVKHKYLQNEIKSINKIEIEKLKEMIKLQNDKQNNEFLQEIICFNRAKNYPDNTQLSIKRIDLYISLFPYLKQMLRFFFSYFHKINRIPEAEYFILYEFKINKNDLSTLQICKTLYKKENTKLYTSLLIQFYEANKQELPIDATGLLLEIYVNCKTIKQYEQAANYLHTCLTSKQNTLNLEAKRKLIVQAAYIFYYLGKEDLFFSYYNQINNISQYVQLKIFYYSTIKDYQQVKSIIEKNYLNKKNNQIGSFLILEYYTIAILKLGLYQNLDIIYKKLKQATMLQKTINYNYILYSKILFANKQYKYVISFLDLNMENLINSLGNQNSDDICLINFYLSLSYFFLKQYDQALKVSETFIALYNTKNPDVPERFKQMYKDLIIVQIISHAKKQQISVAQNLIKQHFNELEFSEINLRSDQLAVTVAELEYVMLKKEIDCLSTLNKEMEVYENELRKFVNLSDNV